MNIHFGHRVGKYDPEYLIKLGVVLVFHIFYYSPSNSLNVKKGGFQQAQRRAAAARSRHKSQKVIQY